MDRIGLQTWQWLSLIGVMMVAGVTVTVFAFQTFEAKGASATVEEKIDRRLRRIERKQDIMLSHWNIKPPTERAVEEE